MAIKRLEKLGPTGKRIGVVVPTVRGDAFRSFLAAWAPIFGKHKVQLYVIADGISARAMLDCLAIEVMGAAHGFQVHWHDHSSIEAELEKNAWIIPTRTDCVRSFGYYQAWKDRCDITVTLDDDVLPSFNWEGKDPIEGHVHFLTSGAPLYTPTVSGADVRGSLRNLGLTAPVVVSHGLWSGVTDMYGKDRLRTGLQIPDSFTNTVVPPGNWAAMCGMNLGFRTYITPIMYFLLMGEGHPSHRFGDIWCGLLAKRVLDHHGLRMWTGAPYVIHLGLSDPAKNAEAETWALERHPRLVQLLYGAPFYIPGNPALAGPYSLAKTYLFLLSRAANFMCHTEEERVYFVKLRKAASKWVNLFLRRKK